MAQSTHDKKKKLTPANRVDAARAAAAAAARPNSAFWALHTTCALEGLCAKGHDGSTKINEDNKDRQTARV